MLISPWSWWNVRHKAAGHFVCTLWCCLLTRSRIHECTASLRILGIILRVLKLEVFVYNVYIANQFLCTFHIAVDFKLFCTKGCMQRWAAILKNVSVKAIPLHIFWEKKLNKAIQFCWAKFFSCWSERKNRKKVFLHRAIEKTEKKF